MKLTGYNSIKSWGVAVACSFVTCLAILPLKVSGMLFVAFLTRYNTDRQNAAFALILNGVIASVSSPLVGYLGEIFEMRTLIIMGCLLSSAGVGICYLAEDIITVTISLGFICGIGFGLQLFLLPMILKQHFTKNLASANGVIWIGTSVLSVALIPIVQSLLDTYGVSGALLISCGIMLHAVPVTMLLRDPKYKVTTVSVSDKQSNANGEEHLDFDPIGKIVTANPVVKDNAKCLVEDISASSNVYMHKETEVIKQNTFNCNEQLTKSSNSSTLFESPSNMKETINFDHMNEHISYNALQKDSPCEQSPQNETQNKYIQALKVLAILKNPPFLVIMFSVGALSYCDVIISTIIVDVSRDKGIPQSQEQFLLMLLQVSYIVGYSCLGIVVDRGYLTAARFIAISSLALGLTCCCFIVANSFATLMATVLLFGLCVTVYSSVNPSLVYEYIEETKQSMAMASRTLLYAPLSLTMGPIVQHFRGTLGSYNGVLYLLAGFSVACSALLLLLPSISRCTNKKH